ncbi:voltage-gated sodium channel [Methylohalomonas lacus]|uniref:Voltage-gated sodium channel n=1 Tax=Methylohalomonas lacus TaxID=398773 RepID=A0AAE3L5M2_9GAMM|nr:ion transporter [Methylohalomonas lacus]MCS3903552.1 voltage-gated sodium channel [Methylohalomonas lacus]
MSLSSIRRQVGNWIESQPIQNFIIGVIIFNAITLGLETSSIVQRHGGGLLDTLETFVLTIFVIEILLKLLAFDIRFFKSGWNVFDFLIVGISLVPASGPLAILRALRILRILRLVTKLQRLRHIVESLLKALPSIGWIAVLLLMVFYIYAVMGTQMFGEAFPDDFGHMGLTLYSLFQIMTLESWSEAIGRPVMEAFPYAWLYFVSFILLTAFTVLNLFIGIIVNTMQEKHQEEEAEQRSQIESRAHSERGEMLNIMRRMDERLQRVEKQLEGSAD